MVDPTPTRAGYSVHVEDYADMLRSLSAENQALRERAEAAEAEREMLKAAVFGSSDYWTSLAIGNFCEMARTTEAARKEAQGQLTAARRAEASAWNDAIEAVRPVAITCFASGCDAHELDDTIRALRRAAPTEGEA